MKRTIPALFLFMLALLVIAAALFLAQRRGGFSGPTNPIARFALPLQKRFTLNGHIEERLLAGSYVYYRVRDTTGAAHWIVSLRGGAEARDDVAATVYAHAESFYSKRLGRAFSPLWFGTLRAVSPATSTQLQKKEGP